jgi:hypothetical protein
MGVLPYLAIGGLLYLMAKNAGTLKASGTAAATAPAAGSVGNNCGTNDFGVNNPTCWCG